MEITAIHISLRDERRLKGYAHVVFDDSFVVHGLKIIHGFKGYFISMPCRRRRDGDYQDIAHPISNEFRAMMEKKIMEKYWETIEEKWGSKAFFEEMKIAEDCREF